MRRDPRSGRSPDASNRSRRIKMKWEDALGLLSEPKKYFDLRRDPTKLGRALMPRTGAKEVKKAGEELSSPSGSS